MNVENLVKGEATKGEIIAVSGLPRSGTSLMMSMLEAGGMQLLIDNVRSADDDNPKGYFEYERVKKLRDGDIAWLPEAEGKAVKIISYLLQHLSDHHEYRVIFMQRDLSEILASQRKMLINRGEDPDKVDEDELRRLMLAHLDQVQKWMQQQSNISTLEVQYRDLIDHTEEQIPRIDDFLGNVLNREKMASVIDPTLYRQKAQ